MTRYLKSILDEQAASVAFKPPDLQTITRAGNRRIGQRRVAWLAGVAVLAVAAGTIAVTNIQGRTTPNGGSGPWPAGTASWAVGSTIHAGPDTIEVGRVVRAYVRTAVGFAVVDDGDNVFSVTADGVEQIGHLKATLPDNRDQQRLVSDPRGTLVGWLGDDQTYYIYDQATGRTRSYPIGTRPVEDALFFAIDDHTAYWRTSWNVYAVDLDTGEERLFKPGPAHDFEVYSAAEGTVAFSPNADTTFFAGRSVADARTVLDLSTQRPSGSTDPVRLSPTGSWLSLGLAEIEGDSEENMRVVRITPEVYDTGTGERIALRIPGDPAVAVPNVWLDDTTLMVLVGTVLVYGPTDQSSLTVYTCTMPAGSCELATVIQGLPAGTAVAMPDGRWYGPLS